MRMTRLIPQEISAAHSISWDPFLSDANDPSNPHSDFTLFANSRISHVRVDDPGTPGASAQVVSTVDMKTEGSCFSRLPTGVNEFYQGAVTDHGIALVGDEDTGYIALVDYSQNSNGTLLDPGDMVCLTAFFSDGIDDIGPLTGLGADPRLYDADFHINAGLNDAWYNPATNGRGFFMNVFPNIGKMFLAWFTYDTSRSAGSVMSHIGDAGHRWITAFGSYTGNQANLKVEVIQGGIFDASPPAPSQHEDGTVTVTMTDCKNGMVHYSIPSANLLGDIPIRRVVNDNAPTCEAAQTP